MTESDEHLLLHRHLLVDRLEHEVAVREDFPAAAAGDERVQEARLSFTHAPLSRELVELVGDPRLRLVDLLLGEVS